MLKDELDLDGRPNLNLASFAGTYMMEMEAEALMVEKQHMSAGLLEQQRKHLAERPMKEGVHRAVCVKGGWNVLPEEEEV